MMHTKEIKTLNDAQNYVEGCLNDMESGISTKAQTLEYLFQYTMRVMEIAAEATKRT